uniref:Uncharacterized protein n=1 Tax=Fervidicoccus fontis TaxID=683846 RepID=A0A7J3ZIM1_9CREN
MALLKGRIERTSSETKKHSHYANLFIVHKDGRVEQASPVRERRVRGLYKKGDAKEVLVEVPAVPGTETVAVQVFFTRNLRKRVSGEILVYDGEGRLVLKCVYRKLKVRRSKGDRKYSWAVQKVLDFLRVPVKRYNLNTGTP